MRVAVGLIIAGSLAAGLCPADEITFSLSDAGTFASTGTDKLDGLTFTSSALASLPLQDTTSGGAYGPFQLGTFTLLRDSKNDNYQNDIFDLAVTFGLPTGLSGGPTTSFEANLSGNIHKTSASQNDQLTIDFGTGSEVVSFNNGFEQGSFLFSITDPLTISLANSENSATGTLYGNISNADPVSPVPEPGTILLLATAVVGLLSVSVTRKRGTGTALNTSTGITIASSPCTPTMNSQRRCGEISTGLDTSANITTAGSKKQLNIIRPTVIVCLMLKPQEPLSLLARPQEIL